MKFRNLILTTALILMIVVSGAASAKAADKTYKIGLMHWISNEAFIAEMTTLGYIEGKNISYVAFTFNDLKPEDWQSGFKAQLQAMVDAKVDVLVTNTDSDAANSRKTVGNIPIVFARADDPVATGAVKDLIKPAGPATGIITNKPHERRLQLLTEIKPTTKKVYYFYSALNLDAEPVLKEVQTVAKGLGVEIVTAAISDAASMTAALDNVPADADWYFLTPNVYPDAASTQRMMDLSTANHAGLSYIMNTISKGYLMGYGPSLEDTSRQAARIVDRILRGANPAELPVETAENFLTVNLEAAQAINLVVPESVLRQANQIIRPGDFELTPTAVPAGQ